MKIFRALSGAATNVNGTTQRRIDMILEDGEPRFFLPARFTPEGIAALQMMGVRTNNAGNWHVTPDILRALLELEDEE